MKKWVRNSGLLVILVMAFVLAACGNNNDNVENNNGNNNNGNNTGNEVAGENPGFEHIIGIEPGAGVVGAAERAVSAEEGYDLDVELIPSSSAAMATALSEGIENEDWVVVTGWTPHWKFAAFDLKYLDDPKNVFGGEETINTIVRQGLEEDHPSAYQVLDNFKWETSDMEAIMFDIYDNNSDPRDAAQTWIDENRDKVDAWIDGVETVDGDSLNLVLVAWDSEIASTNMIALVLEEIGYEVELTPVDNNPMWQAIAQGTHDATVAAWLPVTHGAQYEQFSDDVIDLGPNLEGAKIGLVVPTYVTIDSIDEITKR